jgi:hypothetical protein
VIFYQAGAETRCTLARIATTILQDQLDNAKGSTWAGWSMPKAEAGSTKPTQGRKGLPTQTDFDTTEPMKAFKTCKA